MRLKEVSNNYRASGLRARDARHVHNGPSVPKHRSGKDTRRWCGGHVGREHKTKCIVKREWLSFAWRQTGTQATTGINARVELIILPVNQ